MIGVLFDHKSRRSPAGFPAASEVLVVFNHCVEGGRYATHFRLPESAAGEFGFPAQSFGMREPGFFENGVPQQMTVGIGNIWEYDDTALDLGVFYGIFSQAQLVPATK